MPALSYRQPGLVLKRGSAAAPVLILELQHHLRQLGYLREFIDGKFGAGTERAVCALQHDLLHNDGRGSDGRASVRVRDYNSGRVGRVTGMVHQGLVECISDMLDDPAIPKLPRAADPRAENKRVRAQLAALPAGQAPGPFLMAVLTQESGLRHYREPAPGDQDSYIVVGLDTNAGASHIITSRGYGAGQYTLFHHPPTPAEVRDFILDPGQNVSKAAAELREKFDKFVAGPTPATRADDRTAEHGSGPLRLCKYGKTDRRYMSDCVKCARDAGLVNIHAGSTPVYAGSGLKFAPTQYYGTGSYSGVPRRAAIGCDWPYAVRRYNGAGLNSYHYQARVLTHLLNLKSGS